jgi:CDP-diacylglycerol--glycerol-3-phosphate 3-phosphatidyltransferase
MQQGHDDWQRAVILVLVTLFGAMATSYVRARAEGLGETCTVGFLQRTERVILLGIGGLLTHNVQYVVLWILAILTLATTFQRIIHVAGKLPGPEPRSPMDAHQEPTVPEKLEPEQTEPGAAPDDTDRTEIIQPAAEPDEPQERP